MQAMLNCGSFLNLFSGWASTTLPSTQTNTSSTQQSRSHFNTALPNSLVKDPEFFLENNSVWFAHSQNNFQEMPSDTVQQEYSVYPNMGYSDGLYLSQNEEGNNSTGKINALYTPMRASDSAERLSPPNKFTPDNNSMWLTDKQTGCAVAIIKWPGSDGQPPEYSMVHLEPNKWNDNLENKAKLETMWKKNDGQGISSFQDAHLKQELLTIFNSVSEGGVQPEGYALSFSSFDDQCNGQTTQVVGLAKANDFVFYEQKTELGDEVPASCEELSFTSWNNFRACPHSEMSMKMV